MSVVGWIAIGWPVVAVAATVGFVWLRRRFPPPPVDLRGEHEQHGRDTAA